MRIELQFEMSSDLSRAQPTSAAAQDSSLKPELSDSLHSIRFVAAGLVFIYHLVPLPRLGAPVTAFELFAGGGYLGVTVFFVLSGFLISYRYRETFQTLTIASYLYFLIKRFARIYPLYLLLLILTVQKTGDTENLLASVTLTQGFSAEVFAINIGQTWSLTVEFLFYLLAPFIFFSCRSWTALTLLAAGCVCMMYAAVFSGNKFLATWTLAGSGIEFAIGSMMCLIVMYLIADKASRNRDPSSLLMFAFLFSATFFAILRPWQTFPWDALTGTVQPFDNRPLTVPITYLFAYLVVGGTLMPYILVINSVRHIGGAGASIMGLTEPPVAAVIAWAVLGSSQALNAIQMVGGLIILLGILVAENARSSAKRKVMVSSEVAEAF
mgnify:CR=1 FL=1